MTLASLNSSPLPVVSLSESTQVTSALGTQPAVSIDSSNSTTAFFSIPLREPPKYDEAVKNKHQITQVSTSLFVFCVHLGRSSFFFFFSEMIHKNKSTSVYNLTFFFMSFFLDFRYCLNFFCHLIIFIVKLSKITVSFSSLCKVHTLQIYMYLTTLNAVIHLFSYTFKCVHQCL